MSTTDAGVVTPILIALAAMAGMGFAMIGIAYRIGQGRGIPPICIGVPLSLFGCAFFALRSAQLLDAPLPFPVLMLGLVMGVTQYGAFALLRVALRLGPLSPLWCAVGLQFLPVIVYAHFMLDDRLTVLQTVGLLAGVVGVICGARQQGSAVLPTSPRNTRRYLAVLLLLFLCNSLAAIGHKELGRPLPNGDNLMRSHGDLYFFMLYVGMVLPLLLDALVRRARPPSWGWAILLGGLGGAGSIIGLGATGICVARGLPAPILFIVCNVFSLVPTALLSVMVFGERPTRWWAAMLACSLLAVLLVNARFFLA